MEVNKPTRVADNILTCEEAERIVEHLVAFPLSEIGTSAWMKQHEAMEKLNVQAHANAFNNSDPFVLEALITFDKLKVLVQELIAIELWRVNVYPKVADILSERNSTRVYFILYHEATIMNLFEVLLFHESATEAIGDAMLDLVDYCARQMYMLNMKSNNASLRSRPEVDTNPLTADEIEKLSSKDELERQRSELEFRVNVVSMTVIRYMTEHIQALPLSCMSRILDVHDFPVSIVPLIENPPWTRRTQKGEWQKFVDQKWESVEPENLLMITKLEAQVWLALFNILCDGECRKRYYFNSHRKSSVLRCRKYINDVIVDQLPVLADVQRYMDELTIMNPPEAATNASLIMEQVPEIRDSMIRNANWDELAQRILSIVKPAMEDEDMKSLATMYNAEAFDGLLGDPKCELCGKDAEKRCSRCKNAWYCSRECQVKAWKGHKTLCDIVKDDVEKRGAAADPSKPERVSGVVELH